MADTPTPATGSDDSEPQLTFNVKSSSDAKYVLTLPAATTVAALKAKLSAEDYANISPERQRLIYSGRVLKDHDTLAACKIKDGNTLHLVRGADSNQRQSPASQTGSSVPPGAGQNPASNVPSNIATGTGANNPLAQLTGARYAGFHQLPGADMFGADGGMGAAPDPDQMLRLLEDPNFAQQMNEAMDNPAVVDMLRNSPMMRDNPMAQAAINDPNMRRMMMDPNMIRMQMQMQRAMGGGAQGGAGAFPMPGATDTTTQPADTPTQTDTTSAPPHPPAGGQANPFAALFANNPTGAPGPPNQTPANPFAQTAQPGSAPNPLAAMPLQNGARVYDRAMLQNALRFGPAGTGAGAGVGEPAPNPWAAMGGDFPSGNVAPAAAPADARPPEERYAEQLRQLNDMGFYAFERNVQALRRSGGSVQGAVEDLLTGL